MSTTNRKRQGLREVLEDLCLSRRIIKKAEGTQTPSQTDVSVPGELPDEAVVTIIEMLSPSLRKLRADRTTKEQGRHRGLHECEVEEISVDRSKKIITKEHNNLEMKEIFEELYLSRKTTKNGHNGVSRPNGLSLESWPGEFPDEYVTSVIEMLRPTIRQLYAKKNEAFIGSSEDATNSTGVEPRCCESEPITILRQSEPSPNLPTQKESVISLDSAMTWQTNMAEQGLMKIMTAEGASKELVDAASNTDKPGRQRRRRILKKKKVKNADLYSNFTDSALFPHRLFSNTLFNKENPINGVNFETKESEKHEVDQTKSQGEIGSSPTAPIPRKEAAIDKEITVFRNKTLWSDTPFTTTVKEEETTEESNYNVDSEPTRGSPSTFQCKIQLSQPDQNSPNELKRFKAILQAGKRHAEKIEPKSTTEEDSEFSNGSSGAKADGNEFCSLIEPFFTSDMKLLSDTSLSSESYSPKYLDEKTTAMPCYGKNVPFTPPITSGEPKEFWAITRINVYPDNSRTYEVMPFTGKKPAELPEKSESVFVLIPPNQGPFVPCDLCKS